MSDDTAGSGFSADQERALAAVLDEIIPPSPDGRLPGAGELGLAGRVAAGLAPEPERREAVARGLAALEAIAVEWGSARFAELPGERRAEALRALESTEPGFVAGLLFPVYAGYYEHVRVVAALGVEAWPPHPDGYALDRGDLTLLEAVRRRPKLYREDR